MGFQDEKDKILEYKVEEAFETLMEAEEIRKDSALMAEVVKYGKDQIGKIKSIADLRKAYANLPDDTGNSKDVKKDENLAKDDQPFFDKVEAAKEESKANDAEVVELKDKADEEEEEGEE